MGELYGIRATRVVLFQPCLQIAAATLIVVLLVISIVSAYALSPERGKQALKQLEGIELLMKVPDRRI